MEYIACPLFELRSKKMLKYLLGIKNPQLFKQNYVAGMVEPYIDRAGKLRLIEPPQYELKNVQKKLKVLLGKIQVPNNVFSGVKGRSYADNARMHRSESPRYLFKIDLTAFFPSIRRETVYRFFNKDLRCSTDISEILTNLTTIDLPRSRAENYEEIREFLSGKNVKCTNHLISGAPTSQILSYLVNHNMFDEMQRLSDKCGVAMSIYVDDVAFSSENYISSYFKNEIFSIIRKYDYQISVKKVKSYSKLYPKLVTGVIIDSSGNLTIKNSLRKKIVAEHLHLRGNPEDKESRQKLRGLITAARQVDKSAYPNIHKYAFSRYPSQ